MSYEDIKKKYIKQVAMQSGNEADAKATMEAAARRLRLAEQRLHEAGEQRNRTLNKETGDAWLEALGERNRLSREYEEAKRAYENVCAGDVVDGICAKIM